MDNLTDLYTDYLLSSFGRATATGLSSLLDGSVSHDTVTRHLSREVDPGKELWLAVKPLIREHGRDDACLIVDDTIVEKPRSQSSALNCWHFDHAQGRSVKGMGILNLLYHSQWEGGQLRVPLSYALVEKPIWYSELATGKERRKAAKTKNEQLQEMFLRALANMVAFRYLLGDSWFCCNSTMRLVHDRGKLFVFELKSNRLACRGDTARDAGQWTGIEQLGFTGVTPEKVYLKGLDIQVLVVRQVFTNKDGSTGVRHLVTNDLSLDGAQIAALYQKRWSVEEYHKGIKQNTSVGKSPASTATTQSNHVLHSVLAYVKLERIQLSTKTNHFALKAKIYLAALKAAYQELGRIQGIPIKYCYA